jgi:hypothetical protein
VHFAALSLQLSVVSAEGTETTAHTYTYSGMLADIVLVHVKLRERERRAQEGEGEDEEELEEYAVEEGCFEVCCCCWSTSVACTPP